MCGIVGYSGERAAPALIDGLYRLEYRGYDSAGIAVLDGHKLTVVKRKGRVKELEGARSLPGNIGVGHTRWATHGEPSERNAHPHVWRNVALVHNGVIENAGALREELLARGDKFLSETDSEVIAHLIANCYSGDLLSAVKEGCARLVGSWALAVLCTDEPSTVVCTRRSSPLVAARRGDELFVSSDLQGLSEGAEAFPLGEGEFARLRGPSLEFFDPELNLIGKEPLRYSCEKFSAGEDAMKREMAEIPAAIGRARTAFSRSGFGEGKGLSGISFVQIVACGTAYHAGLIAAEFLERRVRIPARASIAGEYRYAEPIVPEHTLAVAVSQSGETADTLAAARLLKERGARLVALTNVPCSSLCRLADEVICTDAGRETAVAATKSFNAQLVSLFLLAGKLAAAKNMSVPAFPRLFEEAELALLSSERTKIWAEKFARARTVLFIGRGADAVLAKEGSLKLKEISYLPSEGYPAGELKHGTLALVEKGTPLVAILCNRALAEKTMTAVSEACARGAKAYLVTPFPEFAGRREAEDAVVLPTCEEDYSPVLAAIPLQMLAYYTSLARGADPDRPRNLAKSVTVE